MTIHSSILAWRIPWTEKPGGLQSMVSHRVGHNWNDLACTQPGLTINSNPSLSQIDTATPARWGWECCSVTPCLLCCPFWAPLQDVPWFLCSKLVQAVTSPSLVLGIYDALQKHLSSLLICRLKMHPEYNSLPKGQLREVSLSEAACGRGSANGCLY